MKRPKDMSRQALERIADTVQQALYLGYDEDRRQFIWTPDGEWNGPEVCDELGCLLATLGMRPDEACPFEDDTPRLSDQRR